MREKERERDINALVFWEGVEFHRESVERGEERYLQIPVGGSHARPGAVSRGYSQKKSRCQRKNQRAGGGWGGDLLCSSLHTLLLLEDEEDDDDEEVWKLLGLGFSMMASSSDSWRENLSMMKASKSKSLVGAPEPSPPSAASPPSTPLGAEDWSTSSSTEAFSRYFMFLAAFWTLAAGFWSKFSSRRMLSMAGSMMSEKPMTQEASSTTSVRCSYSGSESQTPAPPRHPHTHTHSPVVNACGGILSCRYVDFPLSLFSFFLSIPLG